jgi:hypothetical protein
MSQLLSTYIKRYDTTPIEIAMAVYWYLTHNYCGQHGAGYQALCVLGEIYTPGMSENGPEYDSVAECIYESLDMGDGVELAYDIRDIHAG